MTVSLLTTKLYFPPRRSNLVSRPRLVECLQNGLEGRLTLVSAPAGHGKTTLAAEWPGKTQRAVTWLSLDEADNDPARFLRYFIAALQVIDENTGKETRSLQFQDDYRLTIGR